ncbi:unnamed protein product [Caenorhabditis bovis]|uniref:NEDD8-activating enzyme E1 regulatory subunit n=1 Tax=Caenorhabditis bovis TaxID=2654633 RepID=A0A8S1EWY1_9PELO|nr:unnamed protein product [Caenorhabditis bovis]
MTLVVEAGSRYDRQVRLWGDEGQASISLTTVCVLGSDSLATEILKSLVLAGIKSFCIVDDANVDESDIGQNFFLHISDVGKSRAETTLEKLKELNPSVAGECCTSSPADICGKDVKKLSSFSVVVSSNQTEAVDMAYAQILHPLGVPFLCVKTCGLLGTIKVCVQEHTIVNTREENPKPDLRLDAPFEELARFVDETNLDNMNVETLRHTPYILLLFKALEIFRKKRGNPCAFPSSYQEKKEIQQTLLTFRRSSDESGSKDSENIDEARNAVTRCFQKTTIPHSVRRILDDPACRTSKEPFWLICEALRRFTEFNNGLLPVRGELPDMTSDSARYTRLATIFHEKAISDAKTVLEFLREVERERGVGDLISEEMCYRFCKNADRISLQRGNPLDYQQEIKNLVEIIKSSPKPEGEESGKVDCTIWLLLFRALDRFNTEKGRYPGTNGVPCTIDAFDLKQRVESILKTAKIEDAEKISALIPQDAIGEICRFGAAELHVISSLIGGVTAQEVIKLATNQFVPLDNTFVFDGHTQHSSIFSL